MIRACLLAAAIVLGMAGGVHAEDYRLGENGLIVRNSDAAGFDPTDPRNQDAIAYQAWVAAGNVPAPKLLPPLRLTITKAEFLGRFTPGELLAIATAAQTVPAVNVWLITAQAYDSISLVDPLTKQGLDALVSIGLLTADRETAILTP